jgi:hypothetical protein
MVELGFEDWSEGQGVKLSLGRLKKRLSAATDEQQRSELISAILREKRVLLKRRWNTAAPTRAETAGRKRAIKKKVRALGRQLKKQSGRITAPKGLWLRKLRPSSILDALYPERATRWVAPHRRVDREPLLAVELRTFSFVHDPKRTLDGLRDIAVAEAHESSALLHFRDPFCMDATPYMVLAEMWPQVLPVFRGGVMPEPIQKVLAKVGLQRALNISLVGLSGLKDVWAFPLQRRRPADSSVSPTRFLDVQSHEVCSDRFCDAINEWLSMPEIRRRLTPAGRAWIKNILDELLDNAERHSAPATKDGDWSVAGFMARRKDGESGEQIYWCHLGIQSIGASFAESLTTSSPAILNEIATYCRGCEALGAKQSRETLTTLYALQDAVTRDPVADAEGRGGFGLQEVLDLVQVLGGVKKAGREPRVTIVSGRSCLMLRPPYIKGVRIGGDDAPRVLWCNSENSPAKPPDGDFVFDLDHRFPGTAISISFTLDPEYLSGTPDGNQS